MATEELSFDVIIVGAGPAGLAAAIHLAKRSREQGYPLSICLLDKGEYPGAHILSGAILDPAGLDGLLPHWSELLALVVTDVVREELVYLTRSASHRLPHFDIFGNEGCVLLSLGQLCKGLCRHAESLGVQPFFGFSVVEPIFSPDGGLLGVVTGDVGRDVQGRPQRQFQPGVRLLAPVTLVAEGARGHLSSRLIRRFHLDRGKTPQHYALGVKEVWEIDPARSQPGAIAHTVGWPLGDGCQGGGFVYHSRTGRLDLGLVVDLAYTHPQTDPFALMQCWKTHPWFRNLLQGGKPLEAGARVLVKGGIQSLPYPGFPGGLLLGDAAGMLDGVRMKGVHHALLSGIAAAEAIAKSWSSKVGVSQLDRFYWQYLGQRVLPALHRARNVQPMMTAGFWPGMLHGWIDQKWLGGRAPWTWKRDREDRSTLKDVRHSVSGRPCRGGMVLDRDRTLFLAGVKYRENQPSHIRDGRQLGPQDRSRSFPEKYYCPAGVFSVVTSGTNPEVHLRPHRCLHCQTCAIKDPDLAILWTPPEGGSGPHYLSL
ncbi:MAG: 4Fe-4S dicluster domain-containing protein [Magnetococcales bacterium]|nr:4Fe-4S dicluster domain-containing protein [Magnetococcales bacterium]